MSNTKFIWRNKKFENRKLQTNRFKDGICWYNFANMVAEELQ